MNSVNSCNIIDIPLKQDNAANISKQNRTRIKALGEILDVIREAGREGVIISTISRKANLSHYSALEKCSKLVSAGLVKTETIDEKNVFVITEKGFKFFLQNYHFNQYMCGFLK